MKACGDCAAKAASKRSTTLWSTPQRSSSLSLSRSVAMRAGAELGLAGEAREVVARVRLEGHHARRQAAVLGLGDQQREHRLVAAVHAVEVADRQRAGGGEIGVMEAVVDAHVVVEAPRPSFGRMAGWAIRSPLTHRGLPIIAAPSATPSSQLGNTRRRAGAAPAPVIADGGER